MWKNVFSPRDMTVLPILLKFKILMFAYPALTIVAIVGIVGLLVYALFVYRYFTWLDNMLTKFSLGLMLGGTLGNLIDRLRFGYVTDFIDFSYWPAFYVADSAITVGVIIFACSFIRLAQAEKR